MARVDKGAPLNTGLGQLQPGWTVENDGYGLLTCRAEFIRNNDGNISAASVRNIAFPGDSRLSMHKFSVSPMSLGRIKITVDCVGIDSTQPYAIEGWTRPQVSGSNGLSTEKIETHPNFFEVTVGDAEQAIAGKFDDLTQSSLVVGKGQTYMEGFNGALFETSATAGRTGKFVGFFRDDYPAFYGKTSYLAPTTVWNGVVYTDASANVADFTSRVGCASDNNGLGVASYDFIPVSYGGPSWVGAYGNQLLVSKVDAEEFGSIYKISYEVRFSRDGFPAVVYPEPA